MTRMILRMDSKRRLTLPATLVPWQPGDYVDITYIESEVAFAACRVANKTNAIKLLKKAKKNK